MTVELTPLQCRFGESGLLKEAQYVTMTCFGNVSGVFGVVTTVTLVPLSTAIPVMTNIHLMQTKPCRLLSQSLCSIIPADSVTEYETAVFAYSTPAFLLVVLAILSATSEFTCHCVHKSVSDTMS